jgi:hypothetical protein
MTMKVQVLFFQGCPNYMAAIDLIKSVAPNASVEQVEIKSTDDARRMRFLGSPTILVDGMDVEPSARTRTDYGFSCRTYHGKGVPSREIVASALAVDFCPPSSMKQTGSFWLAASSVAVAAVASACCWVPLALLGFGMSAAGWSNTLETFRPWLFMGAAILLLGGFYLAYRKESCCTAKCNRTMAWIATPLVLAFALFPLYAGALIDAVHGPVCCVSSETESNAAPSEQKTSLTVLSNDAHELQDAFNADPAAVKVMLVVSPRCPACRRGADVVQKEALAQIQSDKLKVYVVWINRFFGDSLNSAQEATELVSDKRARHFWDGSGALGKLYGKVLKLPHDKKFAWDVYFVFGPKAAWDASPPTPDFWMHQLGGPETGNMLDGGKFREAIVERLSGQ